MHHIYTSLGLIGLSLLTVAWARRCSLANAACAGIH